MNRPPEAVCDTTAGADSAADDYLTNEVRIIGPGGADGDGPIFRLTCASCSTAIVAREATRGLPAECPVCGKAFILPRLASQLKGIIARAPKRGRIESLKKTHIKRGAIILALVGSGLLIGGIVLANFARQARAERLTPEAARVMLLEYNDYKAYEKRMQKEVEEMKPLLIAMKNYPALASDMIRGPGTAEQKLKTYEDEYNWRLQLIKSATSNIAKSKKRLESNGYSTEGG